MLESVKLLKLKLCNSTLFSDYYNPCDDTRDDETLNEKKRDPEYFEFECLTVDQVILKFIL